jgi:DNA-binding LacI/PurR family transcriptional regulator
MLTVHLKQDRLAQILRKRIVSGEYPPGAQLPFREQLIADFHVSSITVQRALDALVRDGFVVARRKAGTFVAPHPPHLTCFALVHHKPPEKSRVWSRFYTAIMAAAEEMAQEPSRRFVNHYHEDGNPDSPAYRRLYSDAFYHRIGGMIFLSPAYALNEQSVLSLPVPRVGLHGAHAPPMPLITPQYDTFYGLAAQYLAQRGRRRVALIMTHDHEMDSRSISTHWSACGLTTYPHWRHAMDFGPYQPQRSIANLLMRLSPEDRPDALIIADDNLVEGAMEGVLAAGVRPGELEIVAQCNLPRPPRLPAGSPPVCWIGFDCRELIAGALRIIESTRGVVPQPTIEWISARCFGSDLSSLVTSEGK